MSDRAIHKVANEVAVSPEASLADLRLPPNQKDLERLAEVSAAVRTQILLDLQKYVISTYLSLKGEEPALNDPNNRLHLRRAAQLVLKKYSACSDIEQLVETIWEQADQFEIPEKLRSLVDLKQTILKGYAVREPSSELAQRVDVNQTSYDLVVRSLDWCAELSPQDLEAAQDQFELCADQIATWFASRVPVEEPSTNAALVADVEGLTTPSDLPAFDAPVAEIKLVSGQDQLTTDPLNNKFEEDDARKEDRKHSQEIRKSDFDEERKPWPKILEKIFNKLDYATYLVEEFLHERFPKTMELLTKSVDLLKKIWRDSKDLCTAVVKAVQKEEPSAAEKERLENNPLYNLARSLASSFIQSGADTLDQDSFSYRRCQAGESAGAKEYSIKAGQARSRDVNFSKQLHNVSAWIPIDGAGTMRLLNKHIQALPPEESEFLYRQVYRVIYVSFAPRPETFSDIEDDHTEISAKVSARRTLTLPLAAGYEIKSINFYDRRQRLIPLEKVEVEVCRLGSFKVISPVRAKSISYMVCPSKTAEPFEAHELARVLPRIKTFLPIEDRIVEKTIVEEVEDPLKRAIAWLSYEFIAHNYTYSKDPFVVRLFNSMGDARVELISALKMGVCDNLSFYVAARLRRVGVPAFVLSGPAYENSSREFSYDPGHSVVGIVGEKGLVQFDVTKIANEHYKNDYVAKSLSMRERRSAYYSFHKPSLSNQDVYTLALKLNYSISPSRSSDRVFSTPHIAAQRYVSDACVDSLQAELADVFKGRRNEIVTIDEGVKPKDCSAVLAICQQRLMRHTERERYPLGSDGRFMSGIAFNAYSLRFLASLDDFKTDSALPKDIQALGTKEYLTQYSIDAIEDPDCPELLQAFAHEWIVENLSVCTESQLGRILTREWLEGLNPAQSFSLVKRLSGLVPDIVMLETKDLGAAGFVLESKSTYESTTFILLQSAILQLSYQIDPSEFKSDRDLAASFVSASIQALTAAYAERAVVGKGSRPLAQDKASNLQLDLKHLEDSAELPSGSLIIGHMLKAGADGYAQLNYLVRALGPDFVSCRSVLAVIKHNLLEGDLKQGCLLNWNFVQRFLCEVQAASGSLESGQSQSAQVLFSASDCQRLHSEFQARLLPLIATALKKHPIRCNWPSAEYPASSLLVMVTPDHLRLSLKSLVEMGVLSKSDMVALHEAQEEKRDEMQVAGTLLRNLEIKRASNAQAPNRLTLGWLELHYEQPIFETCTELHRVTEDRNSTKYVVSCLADAYGSVDARFNDLMRAVVELYEQSGDKITSSTTKLNLQDVGANLLFKRLFGEYSPAQVYDAMIWYNQHAESFGFADNSFVSSDAIKKLLPTQGVSTQDGLMARFLELEIKEDPFGSHLRGLSNELKLRVALAAQLLTWRPKHDIWNNTERSQNSAFLSLNGWVDLPKVMSLFMTHRVDRAYRLSEIWKITHRSPSRECFELRSIYLEAERRVDTYASRSGKNFAAPLSKYLLSQGAPIQSRSFSGDFSAIKSYQPGHRINWKASAKRGGLFSNSYTEEELRSTTLLIDVEWLFDVKAPLDQNDAVALQRAHVQEVFILTLLAAQQNIQTDLVLMFRGNCSKFENVGARLQDNHSEGRFLSEVFAIINSARTFVEEDRAIYPEASIPAYRQTGIAELELARDSLLICGMPTQNLVISHDLLDARAKRGAFVMALKQ